MRGDDNIISKIACPHACRAKSDNRQAARLNPHTDCKGQAIGSFAVPYRNKVLTKSLQQRSCMMSPSYAHICFWDLQSEARNVPPSSLLEASSRCCGRFPAVEASARFWARCQARRWGLLLAVFPPPPSSPAAVPFTLFAFLVFRCPGMAGE